MWEQSCGNANVWYMESTRPITFPMHNTRTVVTSGGVNRKGATHTNHVVTTGWLNIRSSSTHVEGTNFCKPYPTTAGSTRELMSTRMARMCFKKLNHEWFQSEIMLDQCCSMFSFCAPNLHFSKELKEWQSYRSIRPLRTECELRDYPLSVFFSIWQWTTFNFSVSFVELGRQTPDP